VSEPAGAPVPGRTTDVPGRTTDVPGRTVWDGDRYQRRFDELREAGTDVHGEADFVQALGPTSVLDAGCGTGRVAVELARRGIEAVGADVDPSMLDAARRRAPEIRWALSDLALLDLRRTFDVVVMAGNVPLFTPPGTQAAVVAGCARHVAPGGSLVAGFGLGRGYGVDDYDRDAEAAGLEPVARFATWDRGPFSAFSASSDYAVSVHRRPGPGREQREQP
jgi:SAM-dependent methyltransferase